MSLAVHINATQTRKILPWVTASTACDVNGCGAGEEEEEEVVAVVLITEAHSALRLFCLTCSCRAKKPNSFKPGVQQCCKTHDAHCLDPMKFFS